ncbi:alcohol dehydrogenase catalytic domain-containing protein [Solirubrobacter sp. CPCC 204708]|uniref:Alcohol dehydrogenase catalytic domain-containing protein n=1 Tax=Solirubrobacter deserti TaxID=2282478 RepID=A0ABT4RM70_9ACTN|nr:alcohol dehydrogenase catalytic domain-containing protein [Solirubrobacter deserti]MBE2314460.1 alcohol dehydrogenase catalytic domain-containing protein [Solirubrobacter deserti]MDA0139607.1 alcohol dehydrogenase catalytic domain-containing protein [Solirubrobacter deserti]
MRAIEFHGDERLELVERPDPAPAPGQLLIAPTAVGICGTDVEIFEGSLAYFRMGIAEYPIVPGHEWTGVVVDVGKGVEGFSAGDQIVGEVAIGCGVCVRCRAGRSHLCARRTETGIVHMDGAMASRMVFPAAYAHVVPFESRAAALVEPTSVALHGVTRGRVAGQHVVVIGIGPIGLLAAQIARAHGAASVVVSDTRADRLELAATLGFDTFTPVGEDGPDVALLCAGGQGAIRAAFEAVRPGGTVVALGLSGRPEIPFDWDGLVVRDIDLIGVLGSVGYWDGAIELIASGAVQTAPLVTQTFGIEHARDAIERLVDPGSLKVLVEPTSAG